MTYLVHVLQRKEPPRAGRAPPSYQLGSPMEFRDLGFRGSLPQQFEDMPWPCPRAPAALSGRSDTGRGQEADSAAGWRRVMGWLHPALAERKWGFGDPRDPPEHRSLVDLVLPLRGTQIWWSCQDLLLVCASRLWIWGDGVGGLRVSQAVGHLWGDEEPGAPLFSLCFGVNVTCSSTSRASSSTCSRITPGPSRNIRLGVRLEFPWVGGGVCLEMLIPSVGSS